MHKLLFNHSLLSRISDKFRNILIRISGSKNIFSILLYALTPRYIPNVQGNKMYIYGYNWCFLYYTRVYESEETTFIKASVKRGDIVLDIGANIGYFTLLFAKAVGPEGHVYAFEPDPINFKYLSKNVKINGYSNVTLINKAVSSTNGRSRLYISKDNIGDHRTYKSEEERDCIEIEMIRLDDFFGKKNRRFDIIKMDIQGSEYHAVLGMKAILRENHNVILLTEYWPFGLNLCGVRPFAYIDLLKSCDLTLYSLNSKSNLIRFKYEDEKRNPTYSVSNGRFTNLVSIHN